MTPTSDLALDRYSENIDEAADNTGGAAWQAPAKPHLRIAALESGTPQPAAEPLGGGGKRALDLLVSSMTLLLLAPVMAMTALLILLTMGRPVLFSQQRVGFGGRHFACFKFRSMVRNAHEVLERHLAASPEARAEWTQRQKLRNDPRITWVGGIIRKSSIDELPQLFNVIRGDMSCIGPRPVLPDELLRYGHHAAEYQRARPGLSGLWQISGRSNTSYAQRVKLDRIYLRRWSLGLDCAILIRTAPALMKFEDTA